MRNLTHAIFAAGLLGACNDGGMGTLAPADTTAELSIDASRVVATVDERYLSVAVDTAGVVGGRFWSEDGSVELVGQERVPEYDFTRPRLRALAAELAPAFLRIGGTDADRVIYDMSPDPIEEAPEGFEFVLTAAQVDGIFEFAEALDYDVMFTIGAGKGVRDEDKAWTPDMARALLGEFYHELSFGGVSSAYWPSLDEVTKVYPDFLQMGGANLIDVITWHYYPQQSERGGSVVSDPWERGLLLDPERLDIVFDWADEIVDYRDADAPGTPIWFGKTGHAQYGGQRIRDRTIGHPSYGVG